MTPVATLGRRYRLSASHRLHVESYSSERNRTTFGKCNNPHGHGHNYIVEVAFTGPVDPVTGMVVDLAALDAFAHGKILARFDLENLNTLDCFARKVPTTENFAMELHRIFAGFADPRSPAAHLDRVHVEETGNNSFEYAGEGKPAPDRS
jgi:6-pyruvoyltetrahydropterin/6-carboxytetrahydropterin synthase